MLLKVSGLLPQNLNETLSRLAFRYGLPLMLFAGAAQVDYSGLASARYLLAGVAATLLMLVIAWYYSRWRGHPRELRGIFVQATFRSNLAIVGVALTHSAYGEQGGDGRAAHRADDGGIRGIAVWVLNTTLGSSTTLRSVLLGIVRNPLIIGISAGVALAVSDFGSRRAATARRPGLSTFSCRWCWCIGSCDEFLAPVPGGSPHLGGQPVAPVCGALRQCPAGAVDGRAGRTAGRAVPAAGRRVGRVQPRDGGRGAGQTARWRRISWYSPPVVF
ncbi:MAG: AEC family transporter [Halioglobus sp.]